MDRRRSDLGSRVATALWITVLCGGAAALLLPPLFRAVGAWILLHSPPGLFILLPFQWLDADWSALLGVAIPPVWMLLRAKRRMDRRTDARMASEAATQAACARAPHPAPPAAERRVRPLLVPGLLVVLLLLLVLVAGPWALLVPLAFFPARAASRRAGWLERGLDVAITLVPKRGLVPLPSRPTPERDAVDRAMQARNRAALKAARRR